MKQFLGRTENQKNRHKNNLAGVMVMMLLLFACFQFSGCGRCSHSSDNSCHPKDSVHNSEDEPAGPNNDQSDIGSRDGNGQAIDTLLENELITESIPLGELKPYDRLHFEIEGREIVPQFTSIYQKSYSSQWEVHFCYHIDLGRNPPSYPSYPPFPPRPDYNKKESCYSFPMKGTCKHKWRDRSTNKLRAIEITDDLSRLRLKLEIGGKLYPLGKIVKRDKDTVLTSLTIAPEMLALATKAKLVVQKLTAQKVKTGFMGFGHCDGLGKKNFKTDGPMDSSMETVTRLQEFIVSASVEYELDHGE